MHEENDMTAITVNEFPDVQDPGSKPEASLKEQTGVTQSDSPASPVTAMAPSSATENAATLRAFFGAVLPPLFGLFLLIGVWHLATLKGGSIPSPAKTWEAATV